MTDEQLARRAAAGEESAFLELYDRHKQGVFNFALRTLREEAMAEDVAQEVFLSLYERIGQYDERRGTFKAWLFAIARHECSRWFRRRRRLLVGLVGDHALDPAEGNRAALEPLDKIDLERAVLRLDHKYRLPIILTKLHGFPVAETAAILGISEGTVRQRVFRGLNRLRQYYVGANQ